MGCVWVGRPCLPAGFLRSRSLLPVGPSTAEHTQKMSDAGIRSKDATFYIF